MKILMNKDTAAFGFGKCGGKEGHACDKTRRWLVVGLLS
jgi:hypothetical protein